MGTIRIEADGAGDLSQVNRWFARHRGGVVELDQTRRIALGIPITGARAVLVAVTLQDERRPRPELGGVVRAISSRTNLEPVRLVFEGRSPIGLPRSEAEAMATEVLHAVSRSITTDDLVERVA
jgi:hypothetical protein